jgi:hypothetical protein
MGLKRARMDSNARKNGAKSPEKMGEKCVFLVKKYQCNMAEKMAKIAL